MKNCLIAIALFAVAAVSVAVETTVMKYAPDSSVAAVEINVGKFLKNPSVLEVLNKPEHAAKRRECETKSGVRLTDLKNVMFFVDGRGKYIVLCRLGQNVGLEELFRTNGVRYKKTSIGGKDVFRLDYQIPGGRKALEAAVLEPGILLVGEAGVPAGYFAKKRGNAADLANVVKTIPSGAAVWLAFVNRFKGVDGKIEDPQQFYLTFDLSGKNQKTLEFKLDFLCGSPEGARTLSLRVPMYIMMGMALVFSDDPELGQLISGRVKYQPEGCKLQVTASLEESLVKRIAAYLERNAERFAPKKVSGKPAGKIAPAIQ